MSGRHDTGKRIKELERRFEAKTRRERQKWRSLEDLLPDAGEPEPEARERTIGPIHNLESRRKNAMKRERE